MSPAYQHLYLECATISMQALYKVQISGLDEGQLRQVTSKFHLQRPSPDYKEGCEFTAKLHKPSMMEVLNYLSEAFGFVVFAVTSVEFRNQFFLRKEVL